MGRLSTAQLCFVLKMARALQGNVSLSFKFTVGWPLWRDCCRSFRHRRVVGWQSQESLPAGRLKMVS